MGSSDRIAIIIVVVVLVIVVVVTVFEVKILIELVFVAVDNNDVVVTVHDSLPSLDFTGHQLRHHRSHFDQFFNDRHKLRKAVVRAINVITNAPIVDGDIITIRAKTEAQLPDYDTVMLQYDIMRMASICGGDDLDELEEDASDDERDNVVAVTKAVESIIIDDGGKAETEDKKDESV